MPTATVEIDELRKIIREEMRQVFREEFDHKFMELMLRLIPSATEEEQREVEEMFGEDPGEDDVARVIIMERE